MDVPLSLLPNRVSLGGVQTRCAVLKIPTSRSSVTTAAGKKVLFSREIVCRASTPLVAGMSVTLDSIIGTISVVDAYTHHAQWARHKRAYITTAADLASTILGKNELFDRTASFATTTVVADTYGTPKRVPSTTLVTAPCNLQDKSSSENEADGQRRSSQLSLTAQIDLHDAGVDAYSTVTIGAITYALTGDPIVHTDPLGGTYSTANIIRVGAGAIAP